MKYPPGPRGREVLGFVRRPLPFLEETARRFGPISYFRILNQRIYIIDEPEWIQDILVTRQHLFNRDTGATLLRELVGDGLLTRDEPGHKERRRQLQPAFHRAQMASYADAMIGETVRAAESWTPGSTIDIAAEMRRLTLSIVGACLFGADFRDQAGAIARVLERVIARSRWIAPGLALIEPVAHFYRGLMPDGPSLFFGSQRAELEAILAPVIEKRRKTQTEDILSVLLAEFSDQDATNEIITMVLAGHETTATALAWAWYLLAGHPQHAGRLECEARQRISNEPPRNEDLASVRYAGMVFNEALRLYPPAAVFGRRPQQTVTIAGYEIPRGSSILLSPFITQRNARWFPRPAEFEPDRWLEPAIPKFAFFPFGGGAKMCIGEHFARMEGSIILATLARAWRFEPVNEQGVGMSLSAVLRPDRPMWLRISPSESSA